MRKLTILLIFLLNFGIHFGWEDRTVSIEVGTRCWAIVGEEGDNSDDGLYDFGDFWGRDLDGDGDVDQISYYENGELVVVDLNDGGDGLSAGENEWSGGDGWSGGDSSSGGEEWLDGEDDPICSICKQKSCECNFEVIGDVCGICKQNVYYSCLCGEKENIFTCLICQQDPCRCEEGCSACGSNPCVCSVSSPPPLPKLCDYNRCDLNVGKCICCSVCERECLCPNKKCHQSPCECCPGEKCAVCGGLKVQEEEPMIRSATTMQATPVPTCKKCTCKRDPCERINALGKDTVIAPYIKSLFDFAVGPIANGNRECGFLVDLLNVKSPSGPKDMFVGDYNSIRMPPEKGKTYTGRVHYHPISLAIPSAGDLNTLYSMYKNGYIDDLSSFNYMIVANNDDFGGYYATYLQVSDPEQFVEFMKSTNVNDLDVALKKINIENVDSEGKTNAAIDYLKTNKMGISVIRGVLNKNNGINWNNLEKDNKGIYIPEKCTENNMNQ